MILGRQLAATPQDSEDIDQHGQDHGSHQQGMPGAAIELIIRGDIVQGIRELGRQEQEKEKGPAHNNGTKKAAFLPPLAASMQQVSREHGHGKRDEEVFQKGTNLFLHCHARIFVNKQFKETGCHEQHGRGKEEDEETLVPAVGSGHDGSNPQPQRGEGHHCAA